MHQLPYGSLHMMFCTVIFEMHMIALSRRLGSNSAHLHDMPGCVCSLCSKPLRLLLFVVPGRAWLMLTGLSGMAHVPSNAQSCAWPSVHIPLPVQLFQKHASAAGPYLSAYGTPNG